MRFTLRIVLSYVYVYVCLSIRDTISVLHDFKILRWRVTLRQECHRN